MDAAREELLALKERWIAQIWEAVEELEHTLIGEMVGEMEVICKKHGIDYKHEYGGIHEAVEMFVTNQVIENALELDAASAWDGTPRAEDLEEYKHQDG